MYPAGAPVRLFTAIWPPDDVLERLLGVTRQWRWNPEARPTRAERLHLTLHFIGSVPAQRLAELKSALAVPFEPFEWTLSQARVWRGGIAVLEPDDVPVALTRLHERLAQGLQAVGLPPEERRYRPHVTLARQAFGAQPPQAFEPVRWRADAGYRLVQSLPGGRGYEPLARFA